MFNKDKEDNDMLKTALKQSSISDRLREGINAFILSSSEEGSDVEPQLIIIEILNNKIVNVIDIEAAGLYNFLTMNKNIFMKSKDMAVV